MGSIGTNGGQPYFINSSNKGIRPYTNGVAAAGSAGAFDDAAQDLGASSVRWRNLYLSGGAYIGGWCIAFFVVLTFIVNVVLLASVLWVFAC